MRLSAVIITHNEESNIEACLNGLEWADEIVVLDAMSTDRTCEIARRFTPNVFRKPWEGYVSARRDVLSKAQGEWILSIDADERVTPQLRTEIETVLEHPGFDGYLIPRKAYFLGRWIRHCGWYPGLVMRLLKRHKARVTDRMVHEGLRVDGTVGNLHNPILHYTYPTIRSYFARFNRYTSLAADDLHTRGKRATLADIIFRPPFQFLKMYVLKLGLLDGLEGLILCTFSSFYVFVKYVKLMEIQLRKGRLTDDS
jgi:glycosyltransferase involved in cell wall biosynthesis